MANLYKLQAELLNDGKITTNEVERIRSHVSADGKLDKDDVKFLVNLLSEAKEVCAEFDDLFFPVLREQMLSDGQIGLDEQFQLLKMLYSDGEVRQSEKDFLMGLYRDADNVTPEFKQLCETAFNCPETDWDVQGN